MQHIWGEDESILYFCGRPEWKRPLRRITLKWEVNNKVDIRETGRGTMDWIQLAQDGAPMVGSCEYAIKPSSSRKFWVILEQLSYWWFPKKDSAPWSWLISYLPLALANGSFLVVYPITVSVHISSLLCVLHVSPISTLMLATIQSRTFCLLVCCLKS
jgi:hypothetical protein